MAEINLSYNEKLWHLEPSNDYQMCLFTNLKSNQVYPLLFNRRFNTRIMGIRELNETDFEYMIMILNNGGWIGERYGQIRLLDGEITWLSDSLVDYHCGQTINFDLRQKLISYLLEANNLAPAEPIFGKLDLEGRFKYDQEAYKIIESPIFFIVKDREDDVYAAHVGGQCLGMKQLGKDAFLNLYQKDGRYFLKRFQICAGEHTFHDKCGEAGFYGPDRLDLENLNCELADDIIFANNRIYRLSDNSFVERRKVFQSVIVKGPDDKTSRLLDVIMKYSFSRPMIMALVDPINYTVLGKAINLVDSCRIETVADMDDLKDLAEKAAKIAYRQR